MIDKTHSADSKIYMTLAHFLLRFTCSFFTKFLNAHDDHIFIQVVSLNLFRVKIRKYKNYLVLNFLKNANIILPIFEYFNSVNTGPDLTRDIIYFFNVQCLFFLLPIS